MSDTWVTISFVVSGLLMFGWAIWGVREYRRTGSLMWLWMAAMLTVSFLLMMVQLTR